MADERLPIGTAAGTNPDRRDRIWPPALKAQTPKTNSTTYTDTFLFTRLDTTSRHGRGKGVESCSDTQTLVSVAGLFTVQGTFQNVRLRQC